MIAIALFGQIVAVSMPVVAEEQLVSSDVLPLERRPYDVRLLVAFDHVSLDASAAENVIREVGQAARRCVGELWSLRIREIGWLGPVNSHGLERLDRSVIMKHDPGESVDVWFVATVESRSVGTRVSLRSWQPEVQSETSVASIDVFDSREISVAMLRLCRDLMRPMGVVEQVTDKSVRIRLRAGELSPPDPSFVQLAKGDLLLPMLAYRDKNKVVERLQTIPWTYVTVDEVDASTITGTVQSGLKLALGGKKRGRIDTLVVALRPQHASTRLELSTQTKPKLPLVAHRIEVRTEPIVPRPTEEHPEIDPASTLRHELLTDRRGLTNVPVEPERSLVWLFAYSGQHLLARVPFVPGIAAQVRLEVPDDSTRLAAEADLQMLQGEVIDAVALRNTAFATIRAAAKKDDWATVNQKLALLKRQEDVGSLNDRLLAVRVAGTSAAKARKDKGAEARINRMCDETAILIKAHLSDDKVSILSEEMESLQSAEKEAEK